MPWKRTQRQSNHSRAMEDSNKRMKKRVKKIKKRVRNDSSLTPKVARNTRWDMHRTPATPQYAYRPADSPTHLYKAKYDMIRQANDEIHKQTIRNMETDTEISRILHERDMLNKKTQDLQTREREAIRSKQEAKQRMEKEAYEFKQWEREQEAIHKRDMSEMRRRHKIHEYQDKLRYQIGEYEDKLRDADAKAEYEKSKRELEAKHQKELWEHKRKLKKKELKEKLQRAEELANREATAKEEDMKTEHAHQLWKKNLAKFLWEGSYERNADGSYRLGSEQQKILKRGAGQLAEKGIIVENGERDLIRQRREYQLEEIARQKEREIAKIQAENQKIQGKIDLEKDPTYLQKQTELTETRNRLRELQLTNEKQRRNDRLQEEIDGIKHKIQLQEAQKEPLNPELVTQRDEKIKELAKAKQTANHAAETARLDRQIVELKAQAGAVGDLDQEIREKKQIVADLRKKQKKSDKLAALVKEQGELTDRYNEQSEKIQRDIAHYKEEYANLMPHEIGVALFGQYDPTRAIQLLNEGTKAALGQRDTLIAHTREFFDKAGSALKEGEVWDERIYNYVDRAQQELDQIGMKWDPPHAQAFNTTFIRRAPEVSERFENLPDGT